MASARSHRLRSTDLSDEHLATLADDREFVYIEPDSHLCPAVWGALRGEVVRICSDFWKFHKKQKARRTFGFYG